jgi:hypothetical protein
VTRREIIGVLSRVAASAAGQSFLSSWLGAAHEVMSTAPPAPDRFNHYVPQFFSADEFHALDQFTAILLPTDETPGAREAYVAPFIDFVLAAAGEYAPEMQEQWRHAMEWLMGAGFINLTESEQIALMRNASSPSHRAHEHFQLIKQLAVYAFYTSRAGLVDNLEYKGLAYLTEFPGCTHPEHGAV